jgi:protein-disulfide isomerase
MRRYLPFVIVAMVALITAGSAAMLYRAKRASSVAVSQKLVAPSKDEPKPRHIRGPSDAIVTLEEFADFQCPPCRHLAGVLTRFEQEFHPRLRVIFRHYPLANHRHARAAAFAAEAAAQQGRFWEMHEVLYREQLAWSKADDVRPLFSTYATLLKLDVERFTKDMERDETKARVESDRQHGVALGVQNTPTIFLNGRVVPPPSLNPIALRTEIDAAIKARTPPDLSGAKR